MRLPQSSGKLFYFCLFHSLLFASLTSSHLYAQATAQLVSAPRSFRFGGVLLGKSETQLAILANSGQSAIKISAVTSSDAEFQVSGVNLPLIIPAGGSVPVSVVFTPSNTELNQGTITFTSNAANTNLDIAVAGLGLSSIPFSVSPANISFGQVAVGAKASASLTLTNERSSNKTLYSAVVNGPSFKVSGPSFPITLAPGQTATLEITFTPRAAGETSGSLFIYGPGLNIPLNGSGSTGTTTGQLMVSPGSLNFGSVDVGSTGSASTAFTASGGSVTISSVSSSNSQFAVSGTSFPLTLTAGETADVRLIFSPTSSGAQSATLTISSTASDASTTESLAGTGVSAQYSVKLSWNASSSSVAGYNVYRGTSVGSYSRLNSSLDSTTSYTDNTVSSGNTYYYAATAVSSSGQESSYSAPLKVSVP